MNTLLQDIEAKIAGARTTVARQNVGVVREIGDGVAKIEGRLNSRHPSADYQCALSNRDFHFSNRLEKFGPGNGHLN